MFCYQILPTDGEEPPTEIVAYDAAGVMGVVSRLDCQEADVLRDGDYSFSIKLGDHGVWEIFKRRIEMAEAQPLAAA